MLELPMKTCLAGLMEKLGCISRDSVKEGSKGASIFVPRMVDV
jgi:hypothetical protein